MSYRVSVNGISMGNHFHMNKKKISFLLFLSLFILAFLQNITISYGANDNNRSLTIYSTFQMTEFSEIQGNKEYQDSINISLSSSWNMNNIELNFTDLEFRREIVDIESNHSSFSDLLSKNNYKALAVQINITEPTIIYSVYLHGNELNPATTINISVQINGYDEDTYQPNATVYGTMNLNMSSGFNWNVNTFTDPIVLSKGIYCLILNGTEMGPPEGADIYWSYNPLNPNNPKLIKWGYISEWTNNFTGSPFLYKLDQKIIRELNPEDINMTAKFNGDTFPILNGNDPGEGSLIESVQYSPNGNYINIPLINNESRGIKFNLSYKVDLVRELLSDGNAIITENANINWTITPEIIRTPSNYTVVFNFPKEWTNLTILRQLSANWDDVSVNVSIDYIKNLVIIPNNTIIDGAEWKIEANSPSTSFTLNVPSTTFEPSQELKFSIETPIPGNYTFVLIDPLGFEIFTETIELPGDTNQFSYSLSSNPYEGVYNAYIFFFNETHAGVQHQVFTINVPFIFDPNIAYIIIITVFSIIFVGLITGLSSYQVIKRYRTKRERYRQKIFNMYMDVFNLKYFLVLNKTSGLNVYEQILAGKEMDPTLISGFLQAIRTFGIELTDAEDQSQTIKLEFQNSKILMAEYKKFRLIFIMKENPSNTFLDSIRLLSQDIDEIYGKFIAEFKGNRQHFIGIRELLERNLNISLIYPLKIVESEQIRLHATEKSIISRARRIMSEKNLNRFFVSYLMSDKKEFNVRTAEIILNLIHKNVFQPII